MLSMFGYESPGKNLIRIAAAVMTFAVISHFVAFGIAFAAGKTPLRIGDVPPSASLRNLKGETVTIPGQFRGKVVIIHFWAVGCSSCRVEMAAMESLNKAYSRKGLVVLAVNVGQSMDTVKKMTNSLGITYSVLLDSDKEMAQRYDVAGIPRTYLMDRRGIIRYKIVGESNEDFLKKRILSML
jgi:cytochrome c biogenesis protein CcmG, thiol:disulfide interchange protein DsbE